LASNAKNNRLLQSLYYIRSCILGSVFL
jgi:hypothetical protein